MARTLACLDVLEIDSGMKDVVTGCDGLNHFLSQGCKMMSADPSTGEKKCVCKIVFVLWCPGCDCADKNEAIDFSCLMDDFLHTEFPADRHGILTFTTSTALCFGHALGIAKRLGARSLDTSTFRICPLKWWPFNSVLQMLLTFPVQRLLQQQILLSNPWHSWTASPEFGCLHGMILDRAQLWVLPI